MKKLLFVLMMFSTVQVLAQFNKGDMAATVNIRFYNSKRETSNIYNSYSSLSTMLNYGYFLNAKTEAGLFYKQLMFLNKSKADYDTLKNDYKLRRNQYTAGLYLQQYYPINDRFLFTLRGSTGYLIKNELSTGTGSNTIYEKKTSSKGFEVSINPGFMYLPTDHWGIRLNLGNVYYEYNRNNSDDETNSYVDANMGQVWLGLTYFIR
jgi:hypothetical protein